jgi:hypothetical protein
VWPEPFFYVKSADWPGNKPHPLKALTVSANVAFVDSGCVLSTRCGQSGLLEADARGLFWRQFDVGVCIAAKFVIAKHAVSAFKPFWKDSSVHRFKAESLQADLAEK